MKVVLLAPASVVHTQRWVEGLHARGVELVLATQHEASDWRAPEGVRTVRLPHDGRLGYFANAPALRRLLRAERPDLLNAHYASGYGTTAALAGFRPTLLSVWGSDVHDFPDEGWLQGRLLRRNLRQADAIASTSESMAQQVRRLLGEHTPPIVVTPFGIDTSRFSPAANGGADLARFVVGTVKTLAPKYGIDTLLRAFARFFGALPAARQEGVSLVVVGGGPQRAALEALAATLGIAARTRFVGAVPHAEVPGWLRSFDIYVAASRLDSESFGVAVLEASACGLPVLVSDAGGLPEVVGDGDTGRVVARDDLAGFADVLRAWFEAPAERRRLGEAGRHHVLAHYEWSRSVDRMLEVYVQVAGCAGGMSSALGTPVAPRTVSIIVPCRNEQAFVEAFLAGLWRQELPPGWTFEAIVADGQSNDGSEALLRRLAAAEPRLRVLANPQRIVSAGLNLALAEARGEFIVRMDVHTTYAQDYIAECLATLVRTGADNVGGPWRADAVPEGGALQAAIAAAFQSPAVAGGALSRRLDHDGPVDTVYLGAWPRATFERFGTFDETLVRNQDDEHNLRIVRGGGRVWQSARIRSAYRPRPRIGQVFRQYLQYGYWKPFVMKKLGQPAALRHLIPALFVTALALAIAVALAGFAWPLALLLAAYALAVALLTAAVARSSRPGAAALLRVPLVIATYHVAYGIGSLLGAWDAFVVRRSRSLFESLSR